MVRDLTTHRKVLVAATTMADCCFRGVARYGRLDGWHVVTDMLHTGAYPRGWKGDGIVAQVAYQADLIRHIQGAGVPCVSISLSDDYLPFPQVQGDNAAVGRLAAEHLLGRNFRSFAWAPFIGDRLNRERALGFEAALTAHGRICHQLPPVHRRIGGYWHDDWADYRRTLVLRLQQLPRPAAIFAGNDTVAAEILDVCREIGLPVPDEVAVLGVGNDPVLCESVATPLSSVELDHEEMAFRAAAALDDIMCGRAGADIAPVPPKHVVARLSTDACAVANSHVARALGYIAEHYPDPVLSVAAVAAAVGMSRRHLERSFRAETGCTIHEHIVKRRMHEASRLLRAHPRAKVADIAELVGLERAGTFFRIFRRFFGESPTLHRQVVATAGLPPEPKEPARVSA
jgi:LacI family transcriptional regulator